MPEAGEKVTLRYYLQRARDAMLWKLEGLGEYDVRRPLVPTGTNLLGLVKHLAAVEAGYFGEVFGRPLSEPLPWAGVEDDPTVDLWASPDESREDLVGCYRRVWAHADRTIDELDLTDTGLVPWWPEERRRPTLHRVLVAVVAETHRHAGHADIVRELIDGSAGLGAAYSNLPHQDAAWWRAYRDRVEAAAREAARLGGADPAG